MRESVRQTVIRQNWMNLVAWPAGCLALCFMLWWIITAGMDRERQTAETRAVLQASGLARAYAEQILRAAGQLDQITRQVQYDWNHNGPALSLEDQLAEGLYLPSTQLNVSVVGKDGFILTSTHGKQSRGYLHEDFFTYHQKHAGRELLISPPAYGQRSRRQLVRFTRRLDDPRGGFAGIVNVAVAQDFLASFYSESSIGPRDFLAVSHLSSGLLALAGGSALTDNEPVFKSLPRYEDASGVALFPGSAFRDNEARYVAWRSLADYPLVASVGLARRDLLAAYASTARTYHVIGLTATACLLLFAMLGTGLTYRNALRKHQAGVIRDTYRLATDGAREGFYMAACVFDDEGELRDLLIKDCNERGAAFLGRTKSTLLGRRFSDLPWGDVAQDVLRACSHALRAGFYEDEFRVAPDGPLQGPVWMQRRLVRAGDALAITLRDISDRKNLEETLSKMVNSDALTGLNNRHWLLGFLPLAVERARRDGRELALLFVDLDDFKNINDSLGHHAGDRLLQAAAMRLRALIGPHDHVVRLGGDEFTIVLEGSTTAGVEEVAQRIVAALAAPFAIDDKGAHAVHASIGISVFPRDATGADVLLKNADLAMYAAKGAGKGRYQFFSAQLSERLLERLALQHALQEALRLGQFVIHYQPRINTFTGRLCGMEALVRWNHPTRGLLGPDGFVGIAEESGLIIALGEQVMREVFAQQKAWRDQGLEAAPVSINVSPRQLEHSDVHGLLARFLEEFEMPASLIQIEITETHMVGEDPAIFEQLTRIRSLGIKRLVDDFGVGYSSLSQLRRLNLDVLKVDRTFTADLCNGTDGDVFFRAIVSMAHALGMSVVAEGVETLQQLRVLQTLGCDEVQGYLIARPLPADQVPDMLRTRALMPFDPLLSPTLSLSA